MADLKWKWIPNYLGRYKISDTGIIASFVSENPKIIKTNVHQNGAVKTNLTRNKLVITEWVGKLVLEAFRGKRPAKAIVGYRDGDKQNLNLDNLFWMIRGKNA